MKNLVIAGTRPEVIKLYPFTKKRGFEFLWVNQSKDLKQDLIEFDYEAEERSDEWMEIIGQDWDYVIVQGDTRTAFYSALKAFEYGHKVVHIEAGLRTGDLSQPFPEEGYRRMIDAISYRQYCPTIDAYENLEDKERARVVGQTAIDTLFQFAPSPTINSTVLTTIHRRECDSEEVAKGLNLIAKRHLDLKFVFVEHPNQTSLAIKALLNKKWNISEPLDYLRFTKYLASCYAVITDSGGIQEEAPSLDKPVLVARDVTERPEGITAGCTILGTTNSKRLARTFDDLVANYEHMAQSVNPYGDGRAADRIYNDLKNS